MPMNAVEMTSLLVHIQVSMDENNIPYDKARQIWEIGLSTYIHYGICGKSTDKPRLLLDLERGKG